MSKSSKKAEKDAAGELSPPEQVLMPIVFLICAAVSLFTFNNLLRLLGDLSSKSFAKKGDWQKLVQSYLELAKPIFENIFGHSALSGFKVELIHICLVAILIVMLSMWRSNSISNALIKARLEEKESAKA